jgi:hypothetical protein
VLARRVKALLGGALDVEIHSFIAASSYLVASSEIASGGPALCLDG